MTVFVPVTHHVSDLLPAFSFQENPLLPLQNLGEMRVCGFVHAVRDHGDVLFVDLRDRGQMLQIVTASDLTPASFSTAKSLKPESSLSVKGYLRRRPSETENPEDPLGFIELVGTEIVVHGVCHGLPYPVHDDEAVNENVKLKHRYLQLRKKGGLLEDLKFRSRFVNGLRSAFLDQDFVEVETPLLFKSTPEGSRDFVVPSRLHQGQFYALVQSPQMLKQLLMVGGMERYMQVCRCFRDEDPRADRQPEFTQLDLEVSFLDPFDFRALVTKSFSEALLHALPESDLTDDFHKLCFQKLSLAEGSIQEITYQTAMERYGKDAPDLRFALPLYDGAHALKETGLETFRRLLERGALLKFLFLPAGSGELSRNFLDTLPGFAQGLGGQGLAWLRRQPDGSWQGPIVKFLRPDEIEALLHVVQSDVEFPLSLEQTGPGAMIFFSCHALAKVVYSTMAELRQKLALELQLPTKRWALAWVVDFPLFEWDSAEKRLKSCHHPFTQPAPQHLDEILGLRPEEMGEEHAKRWLSSGYDLVLNGKEIGGGSARIFDSRVQDRIFEILGMAPQQRAENFGFFLDALRMGAPPHCGMALGIDRIVSLLRGKESIREVIAFPKTGQAQCPMSQSPGSLTVAQLRELGFFEKQAPTKDRPS